MATRPSKKLRFRVLTKKQTGQIHKTALRILSKIGMDIQDHGTQKRLKDIGCREGENGHLIFPNDVIEKAISTVPSKVVLYDRHGNVAIDTSDTIPRFSPGLGCIDVLDYETGTHRPCVLQDVINTARVCDKLSNIDLADCRFM